MTSTAGNTSTMVETKDTQRTRRSRSGCHTCRTRKVKCEPNSDLLDRARESSTDCANCLRLGFECHWTAPSRGELYTPPPKRRRVTKKRHAKKPLPTDTSAPMHNQEDVLSTAECSLGATAQARSGNDNAAVESVSLDESSGFGAPDLFFDFGALDEFTNWTLGGESLAFIPLPAFAPVDPVTQDISSPHWVAASHQHSSAISLARESHEQIASNLEPCSVGEGNHHLIQHYLEVMQGYSKVDESILGRNNLFISAFSASLVFPPLFYSILAFSASHLAMEDPSYQARANDYDRQAGLSFNQFLQEDKSSIEGLLSALFVRIKRIHLIGGHISVFLDLISTATEIVSTEQVEHALQDHTSLTRRIIVRLAILDARASQFRLGGGALVRRLSNIPAMSFLMDGDLTKVPKEDAVGSLLCADVLRMLVADVDTRMYRQSEGETLVDNPIRVHEIVALYDKILSQVTLWQGRMPEHTLDHGSALSDVGALSSAEFAYLAVLSALHSALLYLSTIYPNRNFDPESSVMEILNAQLRMRSDVSRTSSPSCISPSCLFLAGICTTDLIRRDWIMDRFKDGQKWGTYIRKARTLLEELFKARRYDARIDVDVVMDQTTGRFVI